MKITKEHEGKVIYALPTGNNTRYTKDPNEPIAFEVIKVNRKYACLRRSDSNNEDMYHIEYGYTQGQAQAGYKNNAGHRFFDSIQEIEIYKIKNKRVNSLYSALRRIDLRYLLETLNNEDIDTLYSILCVEKDSK